MEFQKIFDKKFKRKKFFISLGSGFAGYMFMKTFPLNLLNKKSSIKEEEEVRVKINPLAVSRKKIGVNNG